MACFLRETKDFLLDGGAVTRTLTTTSIARETRKLLTVGITNIMGFLVGVGHMTNLQMITVGDVVIIINIHVTQWSGFDVGRLLAKNGPVDGLLIQSGRSSGGKTLHWQIQRMEEVGQVNRWGIGIQSITLYQSCQANRKYEETTSRNIPMTNVTNTV